MIDGKSMTHLNQKEKIYIHQSIVSFLQCRSFLISETPINYA